MAVSTGAECNCPLCRNMQEIRKEAAQLKSQDAQKQKINKQMATNQEQMATNQEQMATNQDRKKMTAEEREVKVANVDILHQGAQIVLPIVKGKPMDYDTAIQWLLRKKEEDDKEVRISNELICSPLDGAVAFHRALAKKYGWTNLIPTPGFFGTVNPPIMIGVPISATERIQVALGRVEVPGIDGYLNAQVSVNPRPRFVIGGVVRRRHEGEVKEIVKLTEQMLRTESIYRNKAIKISFEWERNGQNYDPSEHAPRFIDLANITESDLIFGEKVQHGLEIGLFTPIQYSEACRRYRVPLKRGVLLYGPYGTGKTLTATVTAAKAIANNWTFVYLDSVLDLKRGLEFATQYAPAVLFAEDIDRVVTGQRNVEMDEILNTLDGVDTKGAEVITVLTTNHVENINPAILRMGRLDTLVEVRPPDAKAAERLVSLYARGLLEPTADLTRIGKALEGKIPAFIREVTERAKIAAIARLSGGSIEGFVTEEDLIAAAHAMEPHADLLKPKDTALPGNPELLLRIPSKHPGVERVMKQLAGNGVGIGTEL